MSLPRFRFTARARPGDEGAAWQERRDEELEAYLYRLTARIEALVAGTGGGGGGGVTDHGLLSGLADDDHPQYAQAGHTHDYAATSHTHTAYADAADVAVLGEFVGAGIGAPISGWHYDNSLTALAATTLALAANRIDLSPFMVSRPITIDRIGVAVSTAVAASNIRVLVYDADANGMANAKLLETANLSGAATGYAYESRSFTFEANTIYWVGTHSSSTPTVRAVSVGAARSIGMASATAANYHTILRRTVTFGSAPATWTFTATDLVANVAPPSVRFRAA